MAGKIASGLIRFRLPALAHMLGLAVRMSVLRGFVFLFPPLGALACLS